ncbi:MAG: hypothetical protein U1A22_15130 [Xanthomonadaceae bacterium]|nr:hypothetical protein [Xanthomonadaceae bacterium]
MAGVIGFPDHPFPGNEGPLHVGIRGRDRGRVMTENVENLILEHLRGIRTDVGSMKDDVRELKARITTLEAGQATIIQHLGHLAGTGAEQHARYDRLAERIERIERRLEITP